MRKKFLAAALAIPTVLTAAAAAWYALPHIHDHFADTPQDILDKLKLPEGKTIAPLNTIKPNDQIIILEAGSWLSIARAEQLMLTEHWEQYIENWDIIRSSLNELWTASHRTATKLYTKTTDKCYIQFSSKANYTDIGLFATADGRIYNMLHDVDPNTMLAFVLIHEVKHCDNSPKGYETISAERGKEEEADIFAENAFNDEALRTKITAIRALWPLLPFFSESIYENKDKAKRLEHATALSLDDKDRSNYSNLVDPIKLYEILFNYIERNANLPLQSLESLEELVTTMDHNKIAKQHDLSPLEISNFAILTDLITFAIERAQEFEYERVGNSNVVKLKTVNSYPSATPAPSPSLPSRF